MILLFGGTGFTGALLGKALIERGAKIRLAGRNPSRLEAQAKRLGAESDFLVVDLGKRSELVAAMEGASAVVSAAGPFLRLGEPVLEAALATATPYVDICAEQRFLRTAYERYESKARRAGVPVVMGMGMAPALADWAARICADDLGGDVDNVVVSHALDNYRPSAGVRRTALTQMAHTIDIWEQDRWEPVAFTQLTKPAVFPEPFGRRETCCFPSAAVITIPRHVNAARVSGYLALVGDAAWGKWLNLAATAVTPALPTLLNSPLGAFLSAESGRDLPFPPVEHDQTKFAILVRAEAAGRARQLAILGQDPYTTTAEIAASAAVTLASPETKNQTGFLAPSEAFTAADWLQSLCKSGLIEMFSA